MSPVYTAPALKVAFIKQYTNYVGRVFRRYQGSNGKTVDILVRPGRHDFYISTNAEAKVEAARRLANNEGI